MYERVKRRVREILDIPSPVGDRIGQAFDVFIVALIALNVVAVVLETVPEVEARAGAWLRLFEWLSLSVFVAEYALRVWSITSDPRYEGPVTGRLRFMATPFAIIDLLAIAPVFFVGLDLRFVRVLRLLRVLKLGRYSESLRVLIAVVRTRRRELTTSLFLVLLALLLTSSFMYYAEKDAQPDKFPSIPATFWWGVVALTTTGYGDVVPVTTMGKLMGGLTALLGVATIALPVGILASGFLDELQAGKAKKQAACPHCGGALGKQHS